MGRVQIVFEDDIEEMLRDKAKRKGDLSRIVNEAVKECLRNQAKKTKGGEKGS